MQPLSIGKYEVVARLARGGMAEVFVGRERTGPRRLAVIKQLLPQFVDSDEYVEMFLDEGRTISLLSHDNIVRMYDFGFAGEVPYLAMEYLHGVDLRTVWQAARDLDRAIPLAATLTIMTSLCSALHHAHQATSLEGTPMHIVHRDVSPQNLVLTFDGGIKLIDFGIAQRRDREHVTRDGVLKGKLRYMAPEQVRGRGIDARTDLYAAGVVLYQLVVGRLPYARVGTGARSEFDLMMAIAENQLVPPSEYVRDLPPGLEDVMLRSLAGTAARRYPSGEAMQGALAAVATRAGLKLGPAAVVALVRTLFPAQAAQAGASGDVVQEPAREDLDALTVLRVSDDHDTDADADADAGQAHPVGGADAASVVPAAAHPRRDHPTLATTAPAGAGAAVTVVELGPRIDEGFAGAARARGLRGAVAVDLGRVERISSYGLREWLDLVRGCVDRPSPVSLYLVRCSEAVVAQVGMVRAFVGPACVVSFKAPYVCGRCGLAFEHTFDCERDAASLGAAAAPQVECPACAELAGLDDDPAYLAPMRRHLGHPVPAEVRAAVEGAQEHAGANRAFSKEVEPTRTRIVAHRAVGPRPPWARILTGVEGAVVLDLSAGRLEPRAAQPLMTALHALGPEVLEITIVGATAEVAALAGSVPRTRVESITVERWCARCGVARTVSVSGEQHRALGQGASAGGHRAPALTCRRCAGPLAERPAPGAPAPAPPAPRLEVAAPRRAGWVIAAVCVLIVVAAAVAGLVLLRAEWARAAEGSRLVESNGRRASER